MAERVARLGARLRPHVKTHKCVEIARLQSIAAGGIEGITVSTLAEARQFAAAGFDDITWAVPISLVRMPEAVELAARLRRFTVLLDDVGAAEALERCVRAAAAASPAQRRIRVLIEIDSGYHRTGLPAGDPRVLALARWLHASAELQFAGLLTHAGQSYACRNAAELAAVARTERDTMVAVAERLRAAAVPVEVVSIGSTPALSATDDLRGITEVRPGNYVFFDAYQAAIGSCALEDIALSVLTSVIGSYPDQGRLVVDAGALALSKDPGPTHVRPDCGYGVVAADDGETILTGLHLDSLSQEHGIIRAEPGIDLRAYPVGARLRILPNHSCLTAALFDEYLAVRRGAVEARFRPVRGW